MARNKGIGGHQRGCRGRTADWGTPPEIIEALGPFDLDPCAFPESTRFWKTAREHYALPQNGLGLPWFGCVWLNPPYGPQVERWIRRLAEHGSGIALVFARTETQWFFRYVWLLATGVFFLRGRIHFYDRDGIRSRHNSGAPSVLVAYGEQEFDRLGTSGLPGQLVRLRADCSSGQKRPIPLQGVAQPARAVESP